MSQVFINKDAEFLFSLGSTFIADGDFDTGVRLRRAAQHLEQIDSQLQHLLSVGPYAQGKHDAYAEVYERSNLPEPERSISEQMREALGRTTVQPRRVEPRPEAKPRASRRVPIHLTNITLEI